MSAPPQIEVGQRWTFVHSSGTRTAYVVESTETPTSPSGIAHLLNPSTGKCAMVTHYWLRKAPSRYSHWIFEGEALVRADEAADPGSGRAAA